MIQLCLRIWKVSQEVLCVMLTIVTIFSNCCVWPCSLIRGLSDFHFSAKRRRSESSKLFVKNWLKYDQRHLSISKDVVLNYQSFHSRSSRNRAEPELLIAHRTAASILQLGRSRNWLLYLRTSLPSPQQLTTMMRTAARISITATSRPHCRYQRTSLSQNYSVTRMRKPLA